jgi:ATP-binding cassette subfamily B protein
MLGAGFTVTMLARGAASLERINQILSEEPDIRSPEHPITSVTNNDITIRNLVYHYPGSEAEVLKNISVDIPEGTFVGILGKTGSGKSTLIKMLPRLLDPPAGTVFLGSNDIREYSLDTLRCQFGLVPQDTFLFSATIEENIAFGLLNSETTPSQSKQQSDTNGGTDSKLQKGVPSYTEASDPPDPASAENLAAGEEYGDTPYSRQRIQQVADISTISRDIGEFSAGFDTEVGERGVTLSGGQKQRIAISRALAIDPPILLFDDALSSVDTESEKSILKELLEYRKAKTNIIISHRVSTLMQADLILVIEDGKIVQQGDHDSLVREEGFYQEVFTLQKLEEQSRKGKSYE